MRFRNIKVLELHMKTWIKSHQEIYKMTIKIKIFLKMMVTICKILNKIINNKKLWSQVLLNNKRYN
jgi:hypothetical protein